MTLTARALDYDDIGTAWGFVLECEDDAPRAWGVDALPAYPTRRDGVYRQRSHVDAPVPLYDVQAREGEDALIARLDGEASDDDDAPRPARPRRRRVRRA